MRRSIIEIALIAAALLLSAGMAIAAETKAAAPGEPRQASAAGKKAPAKPKLVDINSASKAELKRLPGIDDAKADKIIAGRPYLSKAHLVTHHIIPHGEYEIFKKQIIARQTPDPAARPGKK